MSSEKSHLRFVIRSLGAGACAFLIGPASAHLDTPVDGTIIDSEVYLTYGGFRNGQPGAGSSYDYLNDPPLVGEIELAIIITPDWGPGHGGHRMAYGRQWDLVGSGRYHTLTSGDDFLFSHRECAPAAAVTLDVDAWEVDEGGSWLFETLASLTGRALGGSTGASLGSITAKALGAMNGNDPIDVTAARHDEHAPWPSGDGRGDSPHVIVKTRFEPVTLAAEDACRSPDAYYIAPSHTAPRAPTSVAAFLPDGDDAVTLHDDYFPALAERYRMRGEHVAAETGVDAEHTFGRNACGVAERFVVLHDRADHAERIARGEVAPEHHDGAPDETLSSDMSVAADALVAMGYWVARQTYLEAAARGRGAAELEADAQAFAVAAELADSGARTDALIHYGELAAGLARTLYPDYQGLEDCDAEAERLADIALQPIPAPTIESPTSGRDSGCTGARADLAIALLGAVALLMRRRAYGA